MTQDEASLKVEELNQAVIAAVAARKKFMDDHMHLFAKFKVGDAIYSKEGRRLGTVSSLYRYHAGDARFDTSMSIYYEYEVAPRMFDNTSRQPYSFFYTANELVELAEDRLRLARAPISQQAKDFV